MILLQKHNGENVFLADESKEEVNTDRKKESKLDEDTGNKISDVAEEEFDSKDEYYTKDDS